MLKKLRNKILVRFMNTSFYDYLLMNVIPYIRFTMYYPDLRGWKYHQGYRFLKEGDYILTQDSKKLTTVLIGGEYSHAALCVSKNGIFEVAEMTHNNYTESCFFDLCKEADRIAILRCDDWDKEYIEKVIEKCLSFKDAKYDNKFQFGIKALYCSELIYHSDFEKRLKVSLDDIALLGREYISPKGLYNAKNVQIIWSASKAEMPVSLKK